jgi:hypothetical protein
MKKEAKALHTKAIDSLVLGVDHFNRAWDRGRTEAVLILLDRAFELLLKAIIVHRNGNIRDKSLTIGFDGCLRKCVSDASLKCLSEDDAASLQTLNSLRDAAQHYLVEVSEDQLYVHAQAAVTLFSKLSTEVMGLPLKDDIPERVLPVCAKPPKDLGVIFDLQFADIKAMVAPGSRKRLDAKARLRAMAVLQSSLEGQKAQPSDTELDAIVRLINRGDDWRSIFPGVATLTIDPAAEGPGLSLRITKNKGEAVRLVDEGTPGATVVALRKVSDTDFYTLGIRDIAKKFKVSESKLLCVVNALNIQADANCFKILRIGKVEGKRYSPIALDKLHKWLAENDLEEWWIKNRPTKSQSAA